MVKHHIFTTDLKESRMERFLSLKYLVHIESKRQEGHSVVLALMSVDEYKLVTTPMKAVEQGSSVTMYVTRMF